MDPRFERNEGWRDRGEGGLIEEGRDGRGGGNGMEGEMKTRKETKLCI